MAYIYKKVVGKKPYYYLRISKRKGDKVISKDIAYLGSDLSKIRSRLDDLPSRYKPEVRQGFRSINFFLNSNYYLEKIKEKKLKSNPYLNKKDLENIEAIKLHFEKDFLKLNHKTQEDIYKTFLIDFAYNTTSIEGNTITLKEADKLLREDLTPKDRSSREIFDLQNTQKVFFYLLTEAPKFNQELIIKVHDMLLENIDIRKGYRTHEVRIVRSRFKATPYPYIQTDMELLFKWYGDNKDNLHPFVLSILFHQKFEKIHPFSDGNGRTGRMIMNYLLQNSGYPPFIIRKIYRSKYLSALSLADKAGLDDTNPKFFQKLISFLATEFHASYWHNFLV